ncbi:MAG: disulfide oxidoreductase [Rhodospirillaceae bacterium]|nr:disulfide oxidoreductase [Rhodospirillaceae bacterium]
MTNRNTAQVTAVLGPTNTGKTHLAIERMLGHRSGLIGFPLRLLARENYDRVVAQKGRDKVALITGEEKIIPAHAQYYLCTVESMPTDRTVDFLAIDEIQMVGDPERGHVFTERLLGARGSKETMLLGAATVRPLIQKLIPEAEYITRPRLSQLTYAGARKITRLPRRSAVVAFSAGDVYALAELVREQRGGAAVVLGALSPRTRNAQVEMYQNGDVDYLIATDAIGMGLNMDIDHVAFAEDTKFDGRMPRRLSPQELAQIAGRAGRHMNSGTFGVTADCSEFDANVVSAIEGHVFDPLRSMFWRNGDVSYQTVRDLCRSLERYPPYPFFMRKRDGEDHQALLALSRDPDVVERAGSRARVQLLWEVCQVPDFRKTLSESHTTLLTQLFRHLTGPLERLPSEWVGQQMKRFDKTEGDIDTLAGRIAHIRTWTYISHRSDWISEPRYWQQIARAIEDRLSDALHERLTQRFVDRRAAVLVRKLKDHENLLAAVTAEGTVSVEGHRVGQLQALTFIPDTLSGPTAKPVLTAARQVLPGELTRRVAWIRSAPDDKFKFGDRGEVIWRTARIARLEPGRDPLSPSIRIMVSDLVSANDRNAVETRLTNWLDARMRSSIPKLIALRKLEAKGAARGIMFQITEWLGTMPRILVDDLLKTIDEDGRRTLASAGVRFGTQSVFMPDLLKPRAASLLGLLWSVYHQDFPNDAMPPAGRVTVVQKEGVADGFYSAIGYVRLGGQVVRADMTERLAAVVRKASRKQPFAVTSEMLSLAGVGHDKMNAILSDLGYRLAGEKDGVPIFLRRRPKNAARWEANKPSRGVEARSRWRESSQVVVNHQEKDRPESPFAILKSMDVAD